VEQNLAVAEGALAFTLEHHGQGGPGLDGAARVLHFPLGVALDAFTRLETAQPHERRPADQVDERRVAERAAIHVKFSHQSLKARASRSGAGSGRLVWPGAPAKIRRSTVARTRARCWRTDKRGRPPGRRSFATSEPSLSRSEGRVSISGLWALGFG